jgi:hypothetical protein
VEGQQVNRPLRRWHLRLVLVLAPVSAVLLVAAIAARRTIPANPSLAALLPQPHPSARETDRRLVHEGGLDLELRRLEDSVTQARLVELTPLAEPHVADLLVYWSARPAGETLSPDAILVGPLGGRLPVLYRLPPESARQTGELILYSAATSRVLCRLELGPKEARAP